MKLQAINNNLIKNQPENTSVDKKQFLGLYNEPNQPQDTVSFKGAPSGDAAGKGKGFFGKAWDKIKGVFQKGRDFLAEKYGAKLYNSKGLRKFSEKMSKSSKNMTKHMSTLGALLTSSVYVMRTLRNKDLDEDKRNTLAINQGICFIVPTVCAYTVDSALSDLIKKAEYKYSGIQEKKRALGRLTEKELKEFASKQGDRLKGVRTFASLLTFTLIYRYLAPVLVTPAANRIGEKVNKKREEKKMAALASQPTPAMDKKEDSQPQLAKAV